MGKNEEKWSDVHMENQIVVVELFLEREQKLDVLFVMIGRLCWVVNKSKQSWSNNRSTMNSIKSSFSETKRCDLRREANN